MADLSYHGLDELSFSLQELENLPDEIKAEMLTAQADVVADAQRMSAITFGVIKTGTTRLSIKKGRPGRRKGVLGISVYPHGERIRVTRNGKVRKYRNAEIAFVYEYGKRGQKARPFIKAANESSAGESARVAMEIYDRWLKEKGLQAHVDAQNRARKGVHI